MLKKLNSFVNLKKRVFVQSILKKYHKSANLDNEGKRILNFIENEGFYRSNINFLSEKGVNIDWFKEIKVIKSLLDEREKKSLSDIQNRTKGSYAVDLDIIPNHILDKLESFAKSKFLINIIENYFGLGVFYRGVQIRKDLNDGKNIETRLWHCDGEDRKILKIIFYLEPVFENDGPFTFIPKNYISKTSKLKFDKNGRISDNDILKYVVNENISKFHGNLGDCIFVDTCTIYHKGELPVNKPRYAIFFCYNSNYPLNPYFCKKLN